MKNEKDKNNKFVNLVSIFEEWEEHLIECKTVIERKQWLWEFIMQRDNHTNGNIYFASKEYKAKKEVKKQ